MSVPLHGLAAEAPAVSAIARSDRVIFPFSNDDSIDNFQTALDRTGTSEYQSATNRVAVLIGESALTTNIHQIPEETIILLDSSAPMVGHMGKYVDSLRAASGAHAWKRKMGMHYLSSLDRDTRTRYEGMMLNQIEWWEGRGEPHALSTPEMFDGSRALAREKAIIPWRGDITSDADMAALGHSLRKFDAVVTLLNLTNVIPYTAGLSDRFPSFPTAAGYAKVLSHLPTTYEMPILTTSAYAIGNNRMVEATGPFFGLTDLRRTGGDSQYGPVAIRPDMLIGYGRTPNQRQAAEALAALLELLSEALRTQRRWDEF